MSNGLETLRMKKTKTGILHFVQDDDMSGWWDTI